MARAPELSLTEWVVLALVAEGTTHGFDVARLLADGAELGRIWTVRRPLVYRAIDVLRDAGCVESVGTEHGERGPQRQLVRVTDEGRTLVRRWLEQPVSHVREVRTELLLKLALLHRAGRSSHRLIERQRRLLAPMLAGLRHHLDGAEGFDAVLARWRVESAEAVERFLLDL